MQDDDDGEAEFYQQFIDGKHLEGAALGITKQVVDKGIGSGLQLVADLLTNCLISPAPALSRDQKSSIHGRCSN